MSNTIHSMMNGSPCEKAEQLRVIAKDLNQAVDTSELERECERYLHAMKARERAMTEEEVTKLLVEQFQAAAMEEEQQLKLAAEMDKQEEETSMDQLNTPEDDSSSVSMNQGSAHNDCSESSDKLSLLERIELYKQHEESITKVKQEEEEDHDSTRKAHVNAEQLPD